MRSLINSTLLSAPGARPMKWGALRVIILIDESPENSLRKASPINQTLTSISF